jgi:hypothetical protein
MLDAAALAAIFDPEHKVPGWWVIVCPSCPFNVLSGSHALSCEFAKLPKRKQESITKTLPYTFTGPPDLHMAREYNWMMEDWLIARGFSILRKVRPDFLHFTTVHKDLSGVHIVHNNHAAALRAAIEKIHNG